MVDLPERRDAGDSFRTKSSSDLLDWPISGDGLLPGVAEGGPDAGKPSDDVVDRFGK